MQSSGLRVIHPVYYANDLVYPFIHALKLAQASGGELEIVDVRTKPEATEYIGVRSVLEQWKVLPAGSFRSDVAQTGLRVKKVVREGNKRKVIERRFEKHQHDLMVLGVPDNQTNRFSFNGVAGHLAHSFGNMTLFVPSLGRAFVDEHTGEISLRTVLIPVADQIFYDAAVGALADLLRYLPISVENIIMLHTGNDFPPLQQNKQFKHQCREFLARKPLVDAIVNTSELQDVDLIVMATKGRSSIVQKFTGSNTEQVVRKLPCPLLYVSM